LVKMTTRKPTNMEVEVADVEYSRIFCESIKNGLPTRDALEKILASNGAWTEEDNDKINEIEKEIVLLSAKTVTGEEKAQVDAKIEALEKESSEMRKVRNSYFSHSAEAKASDAQRDSFVSQVTEYADSGIKVWKNLDAFKREEDGNTLFRTTYEYLIFSNGMESNIPSETDELIGEFAGELVPSTDAEEVK
jgi:hypothetical protein